MLHITFSKYDCIIVHKAYYLFTCTCVSINSFHSHSHSHIINTAQHTYFRIDFQRPYTLDRFCSRYMHGLAYEMA